MSCGLWQVVQVSLPLLFRKHCDLRKRYAELGDFEIVVVARFPSAVEEELEVGERIARTIRERFTAIAQYGIRQRLAGGLQMTLHAHFHLPVRAQTRGIDDRPPHYVCACAVLRGAHMSLAGP